MFRKGKNKKAQILEAAGKPKAGTFNFGKISEYWRKGKRNTDAHLSDQTFNDLDMDEVYMYVDRTNSRVGQQYLYHCLRALNHNKSHTDEREKLVNQFEQDKALAESLILELDKLNQPEAYYLSTLFQDTYMKEPQWFWQVKALAALSLVSVLAVILLFQAYWFVLFLMLAVNYFVHYWNKQNLYEYGASIPQLLILMQVAESLMGKTEHEEIAEAQALTRLKKLKSSLWVFNLEKGFQTDIGQVAELAIELLRAFFLIEPIMLFRALKKLEDEKAQIETLFNYVGEIDVCLSIWLLRQDLKVHCKPDFIADRRLVAKGMYHPLIPSAVANDLNLEQRSVLLTGSNMSGKTTFIRALGINAILGQSLNICLAQSLTMPRMHVHSAIRIADDLMSDKSYFFEEVVTIKAMVQDSQKKAISLFLLDELFKGTNTLERVAAGKAILSYLNAQNNMVFIATHDLELADYLASEYDLYHFSETIVEGKIIFDYQLKPGNLVNTNALKILQINNFPQEVLSEAFRLADEMKDK